MSISIERRCLAIFLTLPLLALVGCASTAVERTAVPVSVRTGMLTELAGVVVFQDCADGRRYPVTGGADYEELERAYRTAKRYVGEPVLMTLVGDVALRSAVEGAPPVASLVVRQFRGCFPGETCGNPGATSVLLNSYWKLTRLHDTAVQRHPGQREPHLVFHADGRRLAGSGGCNRLHGTYRRDGENLTLDEVATTHMTCPEGLAQETRFLAALRQVRAWRITGVHLELLGADGSVLARLEDTPLH